MPDFGAGGKRLAGRRGVFFCAPERVRRAESTFLAGVFFAAFAGFFFGALSEYLAAESSDRRVDRGWRAFLAGLSGLMIPP
jgi:hypothetical protein